MPGFSARIRGDDGVGRDALNHGPRRQRYRPAQQERVRKSAVVVM